jgi:hypothetical protein
MLADLETVSRGQSWHALAGRSEWMLGLIGIVEARFVEAEAHYALAIQLFSRLGEDAYVSRTLGASQFLAALAAACTHCQERKNPTVAFLKQPRSARSCSLRSAEHRRGIPRGAEQECAPACASGQEAPARRSAARSCAGAGI